MPEMILTVSLLLPQTRVVGGDKKKKFWRVCFAELLRVGVVTGCEQEIYLCFTDMIDRHRLFLWGVFYAIKSTSCWALSAVPILTTRWQSAPLSSQARAAIFDFATTLTCRLETCPQETLIIASHCEAGACSSAPASMFAVSTALLLALSSGIVFFLHSVVFFFWKRMSVCFYFLLSACLGGACFCIDGGEPRARRRDARFGSLINYKSVESATAWFRPFNL